jgi:predicted dinucleotide-binding enzyme
MNVAVFGTGEVGTAVAARFKSLGHDVVLGSRQPGPAREGIAVLGHADAASHGAILVNALHGEDAMALFPALPLAGKLLIDIGNWHSAIDGPIVETLGESLQRALPDTRVVKAMNFPSAQLMGHPEKLDAPHSVFLAANDPAARAQVRELLAAFGWHDIVDLGDLGAARAMESLAPMWIRLNKTLGHVWFNFALVRRD